MTKKGELSKLIGFEEAVQATTRARTITILLTFGQGFIGFKWHILVVTVSAAASTPLHGLGVETQLLIAVVLLQVFDEVMILIVTHIVVVVRVVEIW